MVRGVPTAKKLKCAEVFPASSEFSPEYMNPRTGFVVATDFYTNEEEQELLKHLNQLDYGKDMVSTSLR